ncbi:hypothetical protein RF11_03633 [Thelohanellus kitauei]|uniref:Uncharacterized protein n=1 Tax=Thelohanellus kitauei TaxID=669202 RepID=A0A0C2MZA0_THEKT|nr:hypothetical protein RF11_03633 [Thelohanellus kitauei]
MKWKNVSLTMFCFCRRLLALWQKTDKLYIQLPYSDVENNKFKISNFGLSFHSTSGKRSLGFGSYFTQTITTAGFYKSDLRFESSFTTCDGTTYITIYVTI